MARVDPGPVREAVEEALGHVRVELLEALGILLGVAHAAGEERVTGEQVLLVVAAVVEQGDRARGVAAQVDGLDGDDADGDAVAVLDVRSTGIGSPGASSGWASTERPSPRRPRSSACQWSPCWWVVTMALIGWSATRASRRSASAAASMSTPSPVSVQRSR